MRVLLSAILTLICLANSTLAWELYLPRVYYGARFEPVDQVLHGAGQTSSDPQANQAFENYGLLLGSDRYPLIFMDYTSVTSSSGRYTRIRDRVNQIQLDTGKYVAVQIGFDIPSDSMPPGAEDPVFQRMCDNLKLADRPLFLRIGYEFNGTWYSPMYQPEPYKAWFRRIADKLREHDVPAATVWCAYPGYSSYYGSWDYLADFYPGNEYVDWWGIDMFSPSDLTNAQTTTFLDKAEQYGKPVLIGEATPTGGGADDADDWDRWFAPFFQLIRTRPGIKAHTYINYDWYLYPSLSTWGDARLEAADPYVRNAYVEEMSSPLFMHASTEIPDEFLLDCNAAGTDTDADGVGDTCDLCPNTVPGAEVDIRGCPPKIACDWDRDGDVDQEDFGFIQACLTGSAVPATDPDCMKAKLDGDGDIDQNDLYLFSRCMSGADVPADPECQNWEIMVRASVKDPTDLTGEAETAAAATFQGLGDLAGAKFASAAMAISQDGSVVVGWSSSASGTEAFRWTKQTGMIGLGELSGGRFSSEARAVSADGSVIVGTSISASGSEVFRWTEQTEMIGLGDLGGGTFDCDGFGVSGDGGIVVGRGRSDSGVEAFRWIQDSGMIGLGDLPGGAVYSYGRAVSTDGTAVVGQTYSASGYEAFRWTDPTGLVGLGDLSGGNFTSFAYAVSADGAVVVGYGTTSSGFEAFRWTPATGMLGLGDLPAGKRCSVAYAVSADGSIVVGMAASASGNEAFLWTPSAGMMSLRDTLVATYGLNLAGWKLNNATGISGDGLAITGSGYNPNGDPEAWVVSLSEPTSP